MFAVLVVDKTLLRRLNALCFFNRFSGMLPGTWYILPLVWCQVCASICVVMLYGKALCFFCAPRRTFLETFVQLKKFLI